MKLSQNAEIAPEKFTRYLLVKRAGCTLDNWQQLEQDIRQQLLPEEAVATKPCIRIRGGDHEIQAI